MNAYDITIQATITKTITVTSKSIYDAEMTAHALFDIANDGEPEKYEQDTIRAELAEEED